MSFPPLGGNTFQFRPKGRSIWLLFLLGGRGWLSVHPLLWTLASKERCPARRVSWQGRSRQTTGRTEGRPEDLLSANELCEAYNAERERRNGGASNQRGGTCCRRAVSPLWISASKDMVQARSKSEMGKKSFLSANPPRPGGLPSLYSTYLPLTKISFWGSLYIYYVYIYIYILRKRYSFSIYI